MAETTTAVTETFPKQTIGTGVKRLLPVTAIAIAIIFVLPKLIKQLKKR